MGGGVSTEQECMILKSIYACIPERKIPAQCASSLEGEYVAQYIFYDTKA